MILISDKKVVEFKGGKTMSKVLKIAGRKKHAAKVKFQVVVETLTGQNNISDISRTYGINQGLIHKWRHEFLERGYLIFEKETPGQELTQKVDDLQRIIGKKEVEIELLKKFLGNLGLS